MHLELRRARLEDLQAIVDIYNHAIENTVATFDLEPVTVAQRREWFQRCDDDQPLFVAEAEQRVVGFAYYAKFREKPAYGRTMEVTEYVAPTAQGKGVGRALLQRLVTHARERGVHVLVAVLGGENPASRALHESQGFSLAGTLREVGYKFGDWVDVYILEKRL